MAWATAGTRAGLSVPGSVSTTQVVPVGTIEKFYDPLYGEGQFIYLPGVASTAACDVVEYTTGNGATSVGATVRWAGTAGSGKPLAVATAATVADTWGWYQVSGLAVVSISGTVAAGDKAFWQATGVVSTTQVNGKQVLGAVAVSANAVPAAGKATYQIAYPTAQGQIV